VGNTGGRSAMRAPHLRDFYFGAAEGPARMSTCISYAAAS
jgi:hypothetical protein